ncbi:hypothetical protein EST38_g13075 [Candolleomyces aberdarensis]|uniref:Cytochrome P450 n=1 Tax=Candolleomyces aberdarensis TaxID=2316362 RepID=A0A4Q2D0T3_9AGAR|nr:hypothetical protein EST38_g13075 [Candolleomyces aberdarensis]
MQGPVGFSEGSVELKISGTLLLPAQISLKTLYPPFEEAKHDFANGKKGLYPSMAAELIDRLPEDSVVNRAEVESIAQNVCGIACVAGAETTVNLALALLYALGSHPGIQRKGQTEIDSVVGLDRLPAVTDIQDLPYLHAIVKEVGRWFTVVPLGIPHSNSEDDEHDGFSFRKGSSSFRITDVFNKPFESIPERYLKDGQIDPSVPDAEAAAFGHGRRYARFNSF